MLDMSYLVAVFGLGGQMVQKAGCIQGLPPSDRQNLYFIVQELEITVAVDDHIDCFGEDLVGKTAVVTDKTDPDGRQLPQVIIFNFSYGDIEFVFQAGSDGFNHLSFTFKREVIRQAQLDFTDADIHPSIINEGVYECLNRFLLFGVTITAIDRTAFGGFEGDLGLSAAFSTGYLVHLAGSALIIVTVPAAGCPALGAAARIIL
jgi:hypothetical protein